MFLKQSICAILFFAIVSAEYFSVFRHSGDNGYYIKGGKFDSAVAYAYYADEVQKIGWAQLHITTNPKFDDDVATYAAGFLVNFNQK